MAGLRACVNFDATTAADAWKGACSIAAPTNQMVKILKVKLTGTGTAGDAVPVEARFTRITKGTGTATAATPQKLNNALTATVQTTAKHTFTIAPTEDGTAPYLYYGGFHPQGGLSDDLTFDEFTVKENTEVLLEVKVPSGGAAGNVRGNIVFEE